LEKLFPNGLDRKVEESLDLASYLAKHYPSDKDKKAKPGKAKDGQSEEEGKEEEV